MKIGVIGLGAMGYNMALNFHKVGKLHAVWNRTASRSETFAKETGGTVAGSISDLARECELILTCVSKDADVIEVIKQLAEDVNDGSIVMDCSTTSQETALEAAAILKQQSAHFLDTPVTGGVEGAKKGTLAIMVGGDKQVLARIEPVLQAIAAKVIHIGGTGSGQACKAVNQSLCAGINQAVTESLAFGQAMRLDMDKVIEILSSGAAGNWFVEHRGRTMLNGTYAPGFKLNLHHKDLMICKEMSEKLNQVNMPLMEKTLSDYELLMEQGYGDEDISTLFRTKSIKTV